jgi:hypothetical protein
LEKDGVAPHSLAEMLKNDENLGYQSSSIDSLRRKAISVRKNVKEKKSKKKKGLDAYLQQDFMPPVVTVTLPHPDAELKQENKNLKRKLEQTNKELFLSEAKKSAFEEKSSQCLDEVRVLSERANFAEATVAKQQVVIETTTDALSKSQKELQI